MSSEPWRSGCGEAAADVAAELAEWAAGPAIPLTPLLRQRATDALIDIIGCMIAGAGDPSTRGVLNAVRSFGAGRALAFGTAERLPGPWAALVSGTAAHALDFDDNFAPAFTHATAVSAPALLVLADELDATGERLLDAYVVGLELQARISRLLNPRHYEKGWHATATIGAIGTAGACARLLGLGPAGILAALSIASSLAGGSKAQFGSPMKSIHAGLAAKNAVLAARLAEAGITGTAEPFASEMGLQGLMADGATQDQAEQALEGLGTSFALASHGLLVKRFPCCGAAHKTLDGIAALREAHRFEPEEVERVVTTIPALFRQNLRFDHPRTETEARFSLTYCAARVLRTGRLTLADMTPKRVNEPGLAPWLDKIRVVADPADWRGIEAIVETRIDLVDGRSVTIAVGEVKGSASHPLTAEELAMKFEDCCRWAGRSDAEPYAIAREFATTGSVSETAFRLQEILFDCRSRLTQAVGPSCP
ncbi:MAG TPA: MmgE/PrpD family protein [Paracoccaceae bacterium]|nr:MmgE/PrpD family protein [Paracoccaceae bacterium]